MELSWRQPGTTPRVSPWPALLFDLVNAGIPVPVGDVGPGGSTKARITGDVAASVDPGWKSLNLKTQRGKVEDALGAILAEKAAARG